MTRILAVIKCPSAHSGLKAWCCKDAAGSGVRANAGSGHCYVLCHAAAMPRLHTAQHPPACCKPTGSSGPQAVTGEHIPADQRHQNKPYGSALIAAVSQLGARGQPVPSARSANWHQQHSLGIQAQPPRQGLCSSCGSQGQAPIPAWPRTSVDARKGGSCDRQDQAQSACPRC